MAAPLNVLHFEHLYIQLNMELQLYKGLVIIC